MDRFDEYIIYTLIKYLNIRDILNYKLSCKRINSIITQIFLHNYLKIELPQNKYVLIFNMSGSDKDKSKYQHILSYTSVNNSKRVSNIKRYPSMEKMELNYTETSITDPHNNQSNQIKIVYDGKNNSLLIDKELKRYDKSLPSKISSYRMGIGFLDFPGNSFCGISKLQNIGIDGWYLKDYSDSNGSLMSDEMREILAHRITGYTKDINKQIILIKSSLSIYRIVFIKKAADHSLDNLQISY